MVTGFDIQNDEQAARERMIAYLHQKGIRPEPGNWRSCWADKETAEIRQAYLQALHAEMIPAQVSPVEITGKPAA